MPSQNDTTIKKLIENAEACLKDKVGAAKIETRLSNVSFWLENVSLLQVMEQHVEIKDISEIVAESKIDIEVSFYFGGFTYRFTIKTLSIFNTALNLMRLKFP